MILILILSICKEFDYIDVLFFNKLNFQIYINSLVEFCKSPEYLIKGAAIYSLLIILAYYNDNINGIEFLQKT